MLSKNPLMSRSTTQLYRQQRFGLPRRRRAPTSQADTHSESRWNKVPPPAPGTASPPSERPGLPRWEYRALFPGRRPSVSFTVRTGGGKYVPDDMRFQIL